MSKPIIPTPWRTARVTRLTPPGSTLTGERGRTIAVGDVVADGESVTLATPDGSAGGVTLDRGGVVLRVASVRLEVVPVAVPVEVVPAPAPASVEGVAPVRIPRRAPFGPRETDK